MLQLLKAWGPIVTAYVPPLIAIGALWLTNRNTKETMKAIDIRADHETAANIRDWRTKSYAKFITAFSAVLIRLAPTGRDPNFLTELAAFSDSVVAAGHELELTASPQVHTAYFFVRDAFVSLTNIYMRDPSQVTDEHVSKLVDEFVNLIDTMRIDLLGTDQGGDALQQDAAARILADPARMPESVRLEIERQLKEEQKSTE